MHSVMFLNHEVFDGPLFLLPDRVPWMMSLQTAVTEQRSFLSFTRANDDIFTPAFSEPIQWSLLLPTTLVRPVSSHLYVIHRRFNGPTFASVNGNWS